MKTRQRTVLAALAMTTGLVLTLAGCGGDDVKADPKSSASPKQTTGQNAGDQPSSSQPTSQALAEVKNKDITLTVDSAKRDQGGFLTLSGKVTNGGGEFWTATGWRGDEREVSFNGASMAGASVVDKTGKKKYLILRDTQGRCLCTKFEGGGVKAGQSVEWYAQFPSPPEGTTNVDFQVGDMPPAAVDITEGE
ncbi:hypothetical protein [Streptomyces sp. NPDC046821]|uniref:hypothetical protein n=1 Tax=Streptomyces sp. NPDC046821 TaxID=3154702 RepID=UPI0033DD10CF